MFLRLALTIFLFVSVPTHLCAREPRNFLFLGGDDLAEHSQLITMPDIDGVQKIYSWRVMEPEEGVYDFTAIEEDLSALQSLDRKLFVQVQDRFFSPEARYVPDYILTDPQFDGGLARQFDNAGEGEPVGQGWTTKQWNPSVRSRFQKLLVALGKQFDGRLYGVNLPETAFDGMAGEEGETAFSCDDYFFASMDNMAALRAAFRQTPVVQYINFWPCEWNNDHHYMERAFALAQTLGIGVGGPDIVPYRTGQMKNSYFWFNKYKGSLRLVAMAIQEPTLTYTNPETGERFTPEEFIGFARDYLGTDVIFWSPDAAWLQH